MGIFNTNRSYMDYNEEIPALEGYNCNTGFAMTLIESVQNDMALFDATIRSDFNEVNAIHEGYEVLNESAVDVLNKIKELFMKLLAKIKGIFKQFIVRISSAFADNRKLYDNYEKTISKYTNWKDFKVDKFRKPKGGNDVFATLDKNTNYKNRPNYSSYYNDKLSIYSFKHSDIVKDDSDIDDDDIKDEIIKYSLDDSIKSEVDTDFGNLNKVVLDSILDDPETIDEWRSGDILTGIVGSILKEGEKNKTKIEKANSKMEKIISDTIKEIEKVEKFTRNKLSNAELEKGDSTYNYVSVRIDTDKTTGNKTVSRYDNKLHDKAVNNKDDLKNINRLVQFHQRTAGIEQQLITKLSSARLSAYKFIVAQARRVWTSAAAYAQVKHEGYELYTAIGESAAYDFISDMETPEVCY